MATKSCAACAADQTQGHPDHSAVLNRLRRARGQLDGIERMIADRRYCVDILTQLRASTSALRSIEIEVLEAHVRACMKDAMSSKDSKSAERKLNELMDLLVRRGG